MQQEAKIADVNAAMFTTQALELRRGGASYREIATQLGISVGVAYKYVTNGLAEIREVCNETAGEVKQIELERLDAMYLRLASKLARQVVTVKDQNGRDVQRADPDEATVRAMLDVSKRRSELLGLDAPRKTEIGGPDGGPIAVTLFDGREVLRRRLADMERRRAGVVVPDAALEVAATPALVSPSLSQNGEGNGAKMPENAASNGATITEHGENGNGNGATPR